MFKSLGNMFRGDEGKSVPKKVTLVYGNASYELEFSEDDFNAETDPSRGITVRSLKFIASRILTPKILTGSTANGGSRVAEAGSAPKAGSSAKLINPSNFTLIYRGKKLLNDSKYLGDYNIRDGDKILVMVSDPERVAAAAAAATRILKSSDGSNSKSKPKSKSESNSTAQIPRAFPVRTLTPEEQIQKVLDQVEEQIVPLIKKFTDTPPSSEQALKEEHHKISEYV